MLTLLLILGTAMAGPDEDAFAPTYGEPVEREAIYRVDPIPQGKRFQGTFLQFDDGERWVVSYRPIPAHFAYIDKRVVVTGRPYWNSPLVQSIQATHFELGSIALAPGETPWDPVPTEIPAPPMVTAAADLPGKRWVMAVGTLVEMKKDPDSPYFRTGTLRMADGDATIAWAPGGEPAYDELVGQEVTLLCNLVEGDPPGLAAHRICPGTVPRCGMTDGG